MVAPDSSASRPKAYGPAAIAVAVVATLAVIALGVIAGRWQYGRYEARADAVRAHDAATAMPALTVDELSAAGPAGVAGLEWRTVAAAGTFDSTSLTPLRGRSVSGVPALHHLAWFITAEGPVLVDVGWSARDSGIEVELPPGELTIEGVLRIQEADDGRRGEGATRFVAAQIPAPPADAGAALPGYLMLREPCEPAGCLDTALQPAPVPQLSLGPHLSYAFQWWLLALLAPFAAVYLLRRDARLERESKGESRAHAPKGERRPARKQPSDEEIEDAL